MILNLLHDRHSLTEVACIKAAIEDSYSLFGVRVRDQGYFYVPFKGPRLDASELLRYLTRASGSEMCVWVVDDELFYPGRGEVFGCSIGGSAILSCFRMDQVSLAKEAIHELGHLLGLNHCPENCVMNLSMNRDELGEKPSTLCPECIARLLLIREAAEAESLPSPQLLRCSGPGSDKLPARRQ